MTRDIVSETASRRRIFQNKEAIRLLMELSNHTFLSRLNTEIGGAGGDACLGCRIGLHRPINYINDSMPKIV